MKIQKLSNYIREYGLHAAAVRAADRLLRRKAEEVSYEKWLLRSRRSSRDYARMAKTEFGWKPLFGVRAYMDEVHRAPFMQSLNLQIYRQFRPCRSCPEAEYILIAGENCILAPDLLWQAVNLLNEEGLTASSLQEAPALIYFDSDRIGAEGRKGDPSFRPEYDAELLESVNYMGRVVLVRADLAAAAPLPSDGEESLHAFLKRVTEGIRVRPGEEKNGPVRHIAHILWHETAQTGAEEGGAEKASALHDESGRQPLVSVLIPNRDHREDLERCIVSLQQVNTWSNLEILILENNSADPGTSAYYEELKEQDGRIRVLEYNRPFNYSAINNYGAENANGEYLLLLNNDTVFLEKDSIAEMVRLAGREETGAVGALLWYPDHTIQHAGIILGHGGIAGHAFAGETSAYDLGSFPGEVCGETHNVSAVTGACLMLRREVYLKAGGMDEDLAVTFNDVDLCMRLRRDGRKILMCPAAQLLHNESVSRGEEDTPEKVERFHREIGIFAGRWERELEEGDPFYNPNLSLTGRSWTCRDELRERVKPYRAYMRFV